MVQAPDLETMNEYWEMYQALIKSSGWDETSFDTEMLKRIDKDWEEWEKKKSIPPPASKLN